MPSELDKASMDEILFCLESDDDWVQEAGILKLCERLKKVSGDVCETAEYCQLTALLTAERPSVARLAARALPLLVAEAVVPLAAALRTAFASVAVGSRAECMVWTVTELVQSALLAAAGGQKAAVPFSGTSHPHVKLLRAMPHRWSQLATETERLLFADSSAQYREVALEYVTPLLWAACGPEVPAGLRARLVSALCRLSRRSRGPRPVLRALETLARLQLPPDQLAVELPVLCRLLVDFALEVDDRALLRALTPLSVYCLQLQVTEGLSDVTSAADDVTRLLDLGMGGDVELVLFSGVITHSSALSLCSGHLIDAARRVLGAGRFSPAAAALLLPPLLRAVSVLPALSGRVEALLPLLAAPPAAAAARPEEGAYWGAVADASPALARAALLAGTLQGGEQNQLAWLNHVEKAATGVDPDPTCECAALALLASAGSSAPVRLAALAAAQAGVRRRPAMAPQLYYCAVFALRQEARPEVALRLLRALPELAVSKTVVPPLVRLLTGLVTSAGQLAPEAVRLLTALWRREERCLPYLLAVLRMEGPLSAQPARLLLARTAAIADLCQHSPTSGKDQLSQLSRALTELSGPESAAACSLALTGIAALCRAEVLDVRTTWRILAPKLRQERRPAVLARYMDFLALVPQLHVPSDEYEAFTQDVAAVLWQQVSGKRPPLVVRAALKALSGFKPNTFTLKMLPPAAKQGLRVPAKLIATPADAAKSPEELLTYVPGECYTELLSYLPEALLPDYGEMLVSLTSSEVKLIGRGVYFTAKERARREGGEPANLSYLEPSSIVRALVAHLKKQLLDEAPAPEAGRSAAETAACLRPLAADLEHALPPLALGFLEDLLPRGGAVMELCVQAMARHCCTHPSAAEALKRLMAVPSPDAAPAAVLDQLFELLGVIGRGVPPATMLPFVQHHLSAALETGGSAACRLLAAVRTALKDERLHEANRTTIGNIMETVLEKISPEQKEVFGAFVECISELPTANLERLSSPSLWWSVEKDKLVVAAEVRSHMSCLGEGDRPMVWMNEIIDVAGGAGLGADVLGAVCRALAGTYGHASNPEWLMDLMGQMRAVKAGKVVCDGPTDQMLSWMADVLASAVLHWSPLALVSEPAALASSQSRRSQLFPAAVRLLLEQKQWRPFRRQACGWLQRLQDDRVVSDRLRLPLLLPALQPVQ